MRSAQLVPAIVMVVFVLFAIVLRVSVATVQGPIPHPAGGVTAWGKPSKGLQAGIRCPKDKQIIPPGQEVQLEIVIRNVSDKAVKFDYLPPTRFWGTVEQGTSTVEVTSMHLFHGSPRSDGLGFANTTAVLPGKEMLLGSFVLGHIRAKDPKTVHEPRPELAPGKYQVGAENAVLGLKGDASDWKLPTGYLDIELLQGK